MSDQVYVRKSRRGLYIGIAVLGAALIAGFAFFTRGGQADPAHSINIVGFAVPEAANKALATQFNQSEFNTTGADVAFKTSYGASGDQSRAVENGLKADYVHFSVGTDVDRLVAAGLVDPTWDDGANKGVVSSSIVVLGVRDGNPKNIRSWDDLTKPGIKIVTANPASSGAARWNALAAWGHVTENGGSEADATQFVDALFKNVVSLTNSGRDATTSFLDGNGDVLLAYENEAILAAQNGHGFEYVIPETTLKIENAGALLTKHTKVAESWLAFVLSDAGQTQFALKGFRPIRDDVDFGGVVDGAPDPTHPFPAVKHLLTLDDFGGWDGVKDKLFGDGKDGAPVGIVTSSIEKSGKATQ